MTSASDSSTSLFSVGASGTVDCITLFESGLPGLQPLKPKLKLKAMIADGMQFKAIILMVHFFKAAILTGISTATSPPLSSMVTWIGESGREYGAGIASLASG